MSPYKFNPFTSNFDEVSGDIAIGDTVTDGTGGSVLFVDTNNQLAEDNPGFIYNDSSQQLSAPGIFASTYLRMPSGTNPTVSGVGRIGMDTDGDGSTVTHGVVKTHDGNDQLYIFPATGYPSSDNDVMAYDSATNSVTWQAQSGGGSSEWTDTGTVLHPADLSGVEDVAIGGTDSSATFYFNNTSDQLVNISESDANGMLITHVSNNHTTEQGEVRIRRARGTIGSETEAFTGTVLGQYAWSGYSADEGDYLPAARIQAKVLTSPTASDTHIPSELEFYLGDRNGTDESLVMSMAGGTSAAPTVGVVSVGTGGVNNGTFNVHNSGSIDAYTVYGNDDGDWSIGVDGGTGDFRLTGSSFLNTTLLMIGRASDSSVEFTTSSTKRGGARANINMRNDAINGLEIFTEANPPTGIPAIEINSNFGNANEITIDNDGGAVFNEQGRDSDFRIEGDDDANLFFADASTDRVGIGTATPAVKLDVSGAIGGSELSADPSDPAEGKWTIWQSDGTGTGDDGDILIKITAGAVTKTATLVDFSTV